MIWIRTQDKEKIFKTSIVFYRFGEKHHNLGRGTYTYHSICAVNDDGFHEVAVYKTKEKCIKALDKLQGFINNLEKKYKEYDVLGRPVTLDHIAVFEMPQENDI